MWFVVKRTKERWCLPGCGGQGSKESFVLRWVLSELDGRGVSDPGGQGERAAAESWEFRESLPSVGNGLSLPVCSSLARQAACSSEQAWGSEHDKIQPWARGSGRGPQLMSCSKAAIGQAGVREAAPGQ